MITATEAQQMYAPPSQREEPAVQDALNALEAEIRRVAVKGTTAIRRFLLTDAQAVRVQEVMKERKFQVEVFMIGGAEEGDDLLVYRFVVSWRYE